MRLFNDSAAWAAAKIARSKPPLRSIDFNSMPVLRVSTGEKPNCLGVKGGIAPAWPGSNFRALLKTTPPPTDSRHIVGPTRLSLPSMVIAAMKVQE